MSGLRNTWLVQRLKKPSEGLFGLIAEAFSFGGGYKNGGLSEDAMQLIRAVCSFDYMGAAEYEFGDVPRAFERIVKGSPAGRTIQITEVFDPSLPLRRGARRMKKIDARVYILAPYEKLDAIEQRVREIATWTHNDQGIKNDYCSFARALAPKEEWDSETCGWLEIDNGFLFFTDEEMFNKMKDLFGVEVTL